MKSLAIFNQVRLLIEALLPYMLILFPSSYKDNNVLNVCNELEKDLGKQSRKPNCFIFLVDFS